MVNPNNETPGATFSGKVGGVKIGVTHGHLLGRLDKLTRSRGHAFVFTGHTHRQRDEIVGKTRVINPGALGGARHEARSVCIVDLDTRDVRFVKVSDF
jgi:predicted phosphodiesterase